MTYHVHGASPRLAPNTFRSIGVSDSNTSHSNWSRKRWRNFILQPKSEVSHNRLTFQKRRPNRDKIHVDSHVLFYRRFLSKQQPCSVCERPLSVFEFNAILPCAHIVHQSCYEEKMINRQPCARCKQMDFQKRRFLDELIKFICCLYTYK
ncbi:hypothetical protein OSTOST_09979 [Ostertagia ostertagi]